MNLPTTPEAAFKDLLNKAHDREGDYLSPSTLNTLSMLATETGISYDEKRWDDEPGRHTEYGEHEISDSQLSEVLTEYYG